MSSEVPDDFFAFSVEDRNEVDECRKENDCCDVCYDDLHEGWQ